MPKPDKHAAIYTRVSSKQQDDISQHADLKKWEALQADPVYWYPTDKQTGKLMERPSFDAILADIDAGRVSKIVIWRLDRLGRTAVGLLKLRDHLADRGVTLISLREGLDLLTPAGRMMFTMIAGVAEYETEVRAERQAAGIAVAKQNGAYTGRMPGKLNHATREKIPAVVKLRQADVGIGSIAKLLDLTPRTVKRCLQHAGMAVEPLPSYHPPKRDRCKTS